MIYNVKNKWNNKQKICLDEGNCVHKDSIQFFKNLSYIPIFTACSQMPSQI